VIRSIYRRLPTGGLSSLYDPSTFDEIRHLSPDGHGKIADASGAYFRQGPGQRTGAGSPIITVVPSAKAQSTSLALNPCLAINSLRMTGISR